MEPHFTNPYAPPSTETSHTLDDDLANALAPLASPAQRLAAALVDAVVLAVPLFIALAVATFAFVRSPVGVGLTAGAGLVLGGVPQLYFQARFGQSIGKRVLKIRVVRTSGDTPTLVRILFLRNFAPALISRIPLAGGLFGLIDSLAIFSANRRCLHDHIADTKVIRLDR